MKCKAKINIPYSSGVNSMLYWKEEPCAAECESDSLYCHWHKNESDLDKKAIEFILKALLIKDLEEKWKKSEKNFHI